MKTHTRICGYNEQGSRSSLSVIDCTLQQIVQAPEDCQHTVLSYVWGPSPSEELGIQMDESLPDFCPLVVEDAMVVTRELGPRYLWVDRYCICQTDEETRHNQIRCMDMIHKDAEIAIIAAAGEDPDYGLPGVSCRQRAPQACALVGKLHKLHLISSAFSGNISSRNRNGWHADGLISRVCSAEGASYSLKTKSPMTVK
jgi:hypothetical protein